MNNNPPTRKETIELLKECLREIRKSIHLSQHCGSLIGITYLNMDKWNEFIEKEIKTLI